MGLYDYRRYLASERACGQLIRQIRWPRGPRCPRCRHRRIWKTHEQGVRKYFCARCRYKFSDTAGTLLATTRTPRQVAARHWALEARRPRSKRNWESRTRPPGRCCAACAGPSPRIPSSASSAGRWKWTRPTSAGGARASGAAGKTVVVPDLQAATFRRLIQQHVRRRSTIYTDGFWDHVRLTGYRHHVIDHTNRFIADHLRYTQTVESMWARTKPDLQARHHSIAPRYLQEYFAERDFMFNHRQHPDMIRVMLEKLLTPYPLRE